jgi:arabinose-5-phosphate isomerase
MHDDTIDNSDNAADIEFARQTMQVEATAISLAAQRLDARFVRALDLLDECAGKVVVTGVGKSGIAARKIAATLTSIGCPSVFLHPSEAMHGDLGIVQTDDVVISLSNSGESEELLAILPALLTRGVSLIAIVGNLVSTLAQKATVVLDASIEREACPLNLAPTTSVVVAMALGDALAMALQKRRHFQPEDYALNHPGGRLGRRLTLRVRDIMRQGEDALPRVFPDATFQDVLCEVSAKHVGATCIVDAKGLLLGIIAESELRYALQKRGADALVQTAESLMNRYPSVTLRPDQLAYEALLQMENRPRPISVAPVIDDENRVVGMVHVHDLVRARL